MTESPDMFRLFYVVIITYMKAQQVNAAENGIRYFQDQK